MTKISCEFCNNDFNIKGNNFLCTKCGKLVQLPNNLDYFSYLNIELTYPIDNSVLEDQYIKLFTLYHPDNFINASDKEKLNSINHSSFLNQAYSVLKNNTKLIQYIYELNTGDSLNLNNENSKDTLIFFFELNEELEQLNNETQVINFKQKIQSIYNKVIFEIKLAFKNNDYIRIKKELFNKLKYIDSIKYKLQ